MECEHGWGGYLEESCGGWLYTAPFLIKSQLVHCQGGCCMLLSRKSIKALGLNCFLVIYSVKNEFGFSSSLVYSLQRGFTVRDKVESVVR
jgi:hypothetical protein